MQKFAEYMNAVDGTRTWDDVEPLFRAAFHPQATYVTADGVLDLIQWQEMAKGLVSGGAVISNFEMKTSDGVEAVYKLTLAAGDDAPLELAARGRFEDGRLIHVEPTDPSAYSEMVSRA